MRASEFIQRYQIITGIEPIEPPVLARPLLDGHPWFRATFTYRAPDGVQRSVPFDMSGGVHDTASTMDLAEMLYRMADMARDGESYEEFISNWGPDVGVTREQWEAVEKATRARCQEWTATPEMWDDFLEIESDDA